MRPYWAGNLDHMSSAWCRFCGAFGLADRMVCSSAKCLGRDLASDLPAIDLETLSHSIPPTNMTITVSNQSGANSGYSLHAYAAAFDMQARMDNPSLTQISLA